MGNIPNYFLTHIEGIQSSGSHRFRLPAFNGFIKWPEICENGNSMAS
jgi:hypothetical protein